MSSEISRKDADDAFKAGIGIGAIVCVIFFTGILVAWNNFQNASWRSDAIEQGFAEYNSVTGKWQWKGDKK